MYSRGRKTMYLYGAIFLVNKSWGPVSPMILDEILRYGAHFEGISVISEWLTFRIASLSAQTPILCFIGVQYFSAASVNEAKRHMPSCLRAIGVHIKLLRYPLPTKLIFCHCKWTILALANTKLLYCPVFVFMNEYVMVWLVLYALPQSS